MELATFSLLDQFLFQIVLLYSILFILRLIYAKLSIIVSVSYIEVLGVVTCIKNFKAA